MSTSKDFFPQTSHDGKAHSFVTEKAKEWRKEAEMRKESRKQVEQGYVAMGSDGLLIAMVPKVSQ